MNKRRVSERIAEIVEQMDMLVQELAELGFDIEPKVQQRPPSKFKCESCEQIITGTSWRLPAMLCYECAAETTPIVLESERGLNQ